MADRLNKIKSEVGTKKDNQKSYVYKKLVPEYFEAALEIFS